nr:MAG TPA: hypothetical protein [Bacteriophage sp.]
MLPPLMPTDSTAGSTVSGAGGRFSRSSVTVTSRSLLLTSSSPRRSGFRKARHSTSGELVALFRYSPFR